MRTTKRETNLVEQALCLGYSELLTFVEAQGLKVDPHSVIGITVYNPNRQRRSDQRYDGVWVGPEGDLTFTVRIQTQVDYQAQGATPEEEKRTREYSP